MGGFSARFAPVGSKTVTKLVYKTGEARRSLALDGNRVRFPAAGLTASGTDLILNRFSRGPSAFGPPVRPSCSREESGLAFELPRPLFYWPPNFR